MSAAPGAGAALVGAHLWRACVEKQRREPEPRPAFLNDVPDDVFKIIARFAAAAKATRDARTACGRCSSRTGAGATSSTGAWC